MPGVTNCWSTRTKSPASSTIRQSPPRPPPRQRSIRAWPAWARPNRTSSWRRAPSIRPNSGSPRPTRSIESAQTAPKQVAVSETRAKSAAAQVKQKKALVEQAKLNLSYCTIVAPVTGIVGKKTVELGENLSPGEQLMAVVPLDDIWIIGEFQGNPAQPHERRPTGQIQRRRLQQGIYR